MLRLDPRTRVNRLGKDTEHSDPDHFARIQGGGSSWVSACTRYLVWVW